MSEELDFNPNRNDSMAKYVVKEINKYTAHPELKESIEDDLRRIFAKENEHIWSKIIVLNKFRPGFIQIVGKARLKILIELLKEIDSELYAGLKE